MKKKERGLVVCQRCDEGACCREGVEVDLFEVSRILEEPLKISKPWFQFIRRDKSFPSGFKFATIVRSGRCVFQNADKRCLIYSIRPRFCVEFPLESGRPAPHYRELCYHAPKKKMTRRCGR